MSALKITFNLKNLKILRPKVKKNLMNLIKKFCEFQPRCISEISDIRLTSIVQTVSYERSIFTRISKLFSGLNFLETWFGISI